MDRDEVVGVLASAHVLKPPDIKMNKEAELQLSVGFFYLGAYFEPIALSPFPPYPLCLRFICTYASEREGLGKG